MSIQANETHDDKCLICLETLKPEDVCASDIELGVCHAACLEDSPVVDLGDGEPFDGPIHTYRYDSLTEAKP